VCVCVCVCVCVYVCVCDALSRWGRVLLLSGLCVCVCVCVRERERERESEGEIKRERCTLRWACVHMLIDIDIYPAGDATATRHVCVCVRVSE
jgi:hypothetical protein